MRTLRSRVRVLGHRGAPRVHVENTLPALAEAVLAQGADGLEFDVRVCGSGEAVLAHDATLERFTGARVHVAHSSLLALRAIDLGGGARVPTLVELLRAPFARRAYLNVELKCDDGERSAQALVDATLRALDEAGLASRERVERLVFSSFEPRVLVRLRKLAPALRRGFLLEPDEASALAAQSWWARVAPHAAHPCGAVTSDAQVRAWRALGLDVNVWTVDAPDEALRLVRAGATAVITNEPGVVGAALREAPAEG